MSFFLGFYPAIFRNPLPFVLDDQGQRSRQATGIRSRQAIGILCQACLLAIHLKIALDLHLFAAIAHCLTILPTILAN
jgi:hypothetical protein